MSGSSPVGVAKLLARSERTSLGIVTAVDGKIAAAPTPQNRIHGESLSSRLKSALGEGRVTERSVLDYLKQARLDAQARFKQAREDLDQAKNQARDLGHLARFLNDEAVEPPKDLPADIKAACAAIKGAKQAGLQTDPVLPSQARETAAQADFLVRKHLAIFNRRKAAHAIGFCKNAKAHLEGICDGPVDEHYKRLFQHAAKRYDRLHSRAMAASKIYQREFNEVIAHG